MNENLRNGFLKLDELVGQDPVKQRLSLIAQTFSDANGDAMPGHMLFEGPPGSGRFAFAQAFADSIHAKWVVKDVRSIEIQGDLTAFLTNFKKRTVCFLEGSEQLKSWISVRLAELFRTGKLRIIIGQGPAAREHIFEMQPFTAIFLTSGSSRAPEGIRNATTFKFRFQHYSAGEMEKICRLHAERLSLELNDDDVHNIVRHSSGLVGNIVRSLRDISSFTAVSNGSADVGHALSALGIDTYILSNHRDLQELSGIEFEHQVCGLLGSMGFQTEMTRASGDGGIDIVAHLQQPIVGGWYHSNASDLLTGASSARLSCAIFSGR